MVKIYKIIILALFLVDAPFFVNAATLSITPSSATFEVGDVVTIKAVVSSNTSMNAVSASIVVPVSNFSIESVSKAESILNFWVTEPKFSKNTGLIDFEGVSLTGFSGNTGTVATIRLRALKEGVTKVPFQSGKILANDGQGTDITSGLVAATFTIKEAQIREKPEEVFTVPEPIPAVSIPEPIYSLQVPEISLGNKYGEPAIVGTSHYPKTQVLLTFISQSGSKIFISGITDDNGDFILSVPNSLRHNKYSVTAVIVLEDGRHSESSKEILITIGNFLSDIGLEFFSLLALLVLIIIYQYWRISTNTTKHLSEKVKKRLSQTDSLVHKSFDILKEDARNKKIVDLRQDINDAEEVISKEIKDIKSL